MHRLGLLLLWLGAIVGAVVALGLVVSNVATIDLHGLAWWMALGVVKLTLLGSAGLMTAGAALLRLARRSRERELAAGSRATEQQIGGGNGDNE
jgi:membrane protein implicated in regulation of membrane protease activity